MHEDPVIQELRDIKQKNAAQSGYDVAELVRSLHIRHPQEKQQVITLPPKCHRPSAATK